MSTVANPASAFEARIDEIRRLAAPHFRRLDAEAREEALQNTLGLCYVYWLRLDERGKADDEAVFLSMIWWAIKHTKMGRMPQGCGGRKVKCVLDYARRGKHGVSTEPFDPSSYVAASASIPDAVAFRLDTPAFLESLSDRDRGIAADLAAGLGTSEVARKRGVSPGAISQARTRIRDRWRAFHGEAA